MQVPSNLSKLRSCIIIIIGFWWKSVPYFLIKWLFSSKPFLKLLIYFSLSEDAVGIVRFVYLLYACHSYMNFYTINLGWKMQSLKAELKSLHVRQAPSPSFSYPSLITKTVVNILTSSYKRITDILLQEWKQCIIYHQMPMIWATGTFTNTSIFNKFMEFNTSDKERLVYTNNVL